MTTDDSHLSIEEARRRRDDERERSRLMTIDEIVAASRLPGPVIARLVPRTWTEAGWMYTPAQLQAAIEIGDDLRRKNKHGRPAAVDDAPETLLCDGCGAAITAAVADKAGWLNTTHPDLGGDPLGRDYCPQCQTPCPACAHTADTPDPCNTCAGTGRQPGRQTSAGSRGFCAQTEHPVGARA